MNLTGLLGAGLVFWATVAVPALPSEDVARKLLSSRHRTGQDWEATFRAARSDPAMRRVLFGFVDSARSAQATPPAAFRRPANYSEIPVEEVDQIALQSGSNRDERALAMYDCTLADRLVRTGVTGAIAARYINDPDLILRSNAILDAAASWVPLQRPGWSLGAPDRKMPVGGDGVNMATSWGINAICDMLEVLGDRVPRELRGRLESNLRREVAAIVDTWVSRRAWYVTSKAVSSNQWIDPSAALVRACLFLGDPALASAYELGVTNLLLSLDAMGSDGAFLEGITYAQMSLPSLLSVTMAMRDAGDRRCCDHPFVVHSWGWMMQMLMPGRALVSVSDSQMSSLPAWGQSAPLDAFSMAAIASGNAGVCSAIRKVFPDVQTTPIGLRFAASNSETPPADIPLWAVYPSQALLVWRSDASAVPARTLWMKGGSKACSSHGHRDAGHVSIFFGATPVLIECGTPEYSDPLYETSFAGAPGHGIMQVRPLSPHGVAIEAPWRVSKLSSAGGDAALDATGGYLGVKSCTRRVSWDVNAVDFFDQVQFSDAIEPGTELYRFHTGTDARLAIVGSANKWRVSWASASIAIESDVRIEVTQSTVPDRVLAKARHSVVVLKASSTTERASIRSTVTAAPPH